jgi:hypothetical protein
MPMKTWKWMFAVLLVLAGGNCAQGQAQKLAEQRSVNQVLDFWVSETEKLVVPAAEAMPEELYSFAPSNGEFKGVRTFAEQVKHLAAANHQLGAGVLGVEPPAGTRNETAPDSVKTKAEIMAYLKDSFTILHKAAAAINTENMNEPIKEKGNRTRLWLLVDAVAHS